MNTSKPIYLDHNATTPVDPRVLEEMLPYFGDKFGNASSILHPFGWDAEEAVEISKERISSLIGVKPNEIYFTSGATEALNLGILGLFESFEKPAHLITCATEHKAVLDTCKHLEMLGHEVTYLPVDKNGSLDLSDLQKQIGPATKAICLMHANNETGLIHPLSQIGEVAKKNGLVFITDATQSVGKIDLNLKKSQVDLAAFSAHKMYGPKGVGALFIKNEVTNTISPQLFGGGQQKRIRPGTLNVPGIVGFGKACEIAKNEMKEEDKRLNRLKSLLETELRKIDEININSESAIRLPHTSNLTIEHIDGSKLIRALKRLAISQGSACNSGTYKPSHVLNAMGLTDELALSSIRIGMGKPTTEEDVLTAVQEIKSAFYKLSKVDHERA